LADLRFHKIFPLLLFNLQRGDDGVNRVNDFNANEAVMFFSFANLIEIFFN
jgi:hypothetical protein